MILLLILTLLDTIEKNLGLSVTVEIEGSSLHKLQVKSLISSQHNSSLPAYAPFNSQNSEKLPAQFVLKLSQPFPMLNTSINQIISEINEPATIKDYLTTITMNSKESLVSLIARQGLDLNKGPFCRSVDVLKNTDSDSCDLRKHVYSIKLPDQHHTYHILDNYLERQDGVYVTKIPFTHPTSIPNIMRVLRQQALFNFVIGSCIRRSKTSNSSTVQENQSKTTTESNIFDIIPVNLNNICISFEHPSKESLATLEIDFKELSCQLYALGKESVCSNEYATKVLQKCWSIPITMRSVLKKCNERRLALLDDASKRRERELQELLTNNNAQQALQYKSHLQYQDTILQSKFNDLSEKSNSRDLNSIAEFLSSKTGEASTSDASNQTNTNLDSANSRSNLLKKFSCKPKAKQNTATKNQTGNKILSSMLKRQNSTLSSSDDSSLKATLTKKAKTKNLLGEFSHKNPTTNVVTTKIISPDLAAKLAYKQAKQGSNQNISLSLIRSPNKTQHTIPSSSNSSTPFAVSLTSQGVASTSKQSDSLVNSNNNNSNTIRVKSQSNGNISSGKPRKSSIGAVLDRLVGGVTPEQNSATNTSSQSESNSELGSKNSDSSKGSPIGNKSKSRTPADQFAIKQGSLGGLKLTVTKTKPTVAPTSSSTTSSTTTSTAIPSGSSSSSSGNNSSSTNNPLSKPETSKILGLSTSTSGTKYTIPKISKTQQASQSSSSQANSTDNQGSTSNDTNSQTDDSTNPSSTANASSTPSSTTSKRTTSTPFNRTNNSNRNPVSSSTHPLGRTTSNPLANASRPSSTSTNDNHLLNRISSSNQGQQIMRQQINNRMVNMQQQQAVQRMVNPNIIAPQQLSNQSNQPPIFAIGLPQQQSPFQQTNDINLIAANQAALLNQQRNHNLNHMQTMPGPFMSSSVDANLISSSRPHFAANVQQPMSVLPSTSSVTDSVQRPSPSVINAAPQFYVRQPMFEDTSNAVSSTPRTTNEASQSSFLDRKAIDSTPQIPITQAPPTGFQSRIIDGSSGSTGTNEMSSSTVPLQVNSALGNLGVSSSSDSGNQDLVPTISTPSSPTECGHAETVPPPPLIPIDSLDEPQATSPEADHLDDASDRLSIVDTNDNAADGNSVAGTPKPSDENSPMNTQDSNSMPSSSSRNIDSATVTSFNDGPTGPVESTPSLTRNEPASNPTDLNPASTTTTTPTSEASGGTIQSSISPSDESHGLTRRQTAPTEEPIAQSSMAATTSDTI